MTSQEQIALRENVLGQVHIYYTHYNTGRPVTPENADQWFISKYLDSPNEPLYPFGHGLSYTTFSYSDLALSETEMRSLPSTR